MNLVVDAVVVCLPLLSLTNSCVCIIVISPPASACRLFVGFGGGRLWCGFFEGEWEAEVEGPVADGFDEGKEVEDSVVDVRACGGGHARVKP